MKANVMDVSHTLQKRYDVVLTALVQTQVFDFIADQAVMGIKGNVNNFAMTTVVGSGLADFDLEISPDGVNYGDKQRIPAGASIPLDGCAIAKIRVTRVAADTKAQIVVW